MSPDIEMCDACLLTLGASGDDAAPAVLLHSDFSTATGQTSSALTDGGKWVEFTGNGDANAVVAVGSEGFASEWPTSNALKVVAHDPTADGGASSQILRAEGLGTPAVGESLWHRWYIRVVTPDAMDAVVTDHETHPIQDGEAISDSNWALQILTAATGTYRASLEMRGSSINRHFGRNLTFDKDVTYRWELQVARTGDTTFALHVRVYESAGVLLYDDADFNNADNSGTLAGNPSLTITDVTKLGCLNAGFNGLGGTTGANGDPIPLYYQGAFAVSDSDWLGPYAGGV